MQSHAEERRGLSAFDGEPCMHELPSFATVLERDRVTRVCHHFIGHEAVRQAGMGMFTLGV